ncbi:hypothetical protein BV898_08749 [Hypsibius exemplaris]|uniref:Uncharacterized protein n=1 Tax=Hypsibius exemplaris TaxID=2072580 RepID=A0A1W0WPN5_HYPEX|nr:hypothetical protein BV898_08749 [Hypsibius exemplaris]
MPKVKSQPTTAVRRSGRPVVPRVGPSEIVEYEWDEETGCRIFKGVGSRAGLSNRSPNTPAKRATTDAKKPFKKPVLLPVSANAIVFVAPLPAPSIPDAKKPRGRKKAAVSVKATAAESGPITRDRPVTRSQQRNLKIKVDQLNPILSKGETTVKRPVGFGVAPSALAALSIPAKTTKKPAAKFKMEKPAQPSLPTVEPISRGGSPELTAPSRKRLSSPTPVVAMEVIKKRRQSVNRAVNASPPLEDHSESGSNILMTTFVPVTSHPVVEAQLPAKKVVNRQLVTVKRDYRKRPGTPISERAGNAVKAMMQESLGEDSFSNITPRPSDAVALPRISRKDSIEDGDGSWIDERLSDVMVVEEKKLKRPTARPSTKRPVPMSKLSKSTHGESRHVSGSPRASTSTDLKRKSIGAADEEEAAQSRALLPTRNSVTSKKPFGTPPANIASPKKNQMEDYVPESIIINRVDPERFYNNDGTLAQPGDHVRLAKLMKINGLMENGYLKIDCGHSKGEAKTDTDTHTTLFIVRGMAAISTRPANATQLDLDVVPEGGVIGIGPGEFYNIRAAGEEDLEIFYSISYMQTVEPTGVVVL